MKFEVLEAAVHPLNSLLKQERLQLVEASFHEQGSSGGNFSLMVLPESQVMTHFTPVVVVDCDYQVE